MEAHTAPEGRLLAQPNYRLYFVARVLSQLGDQMYVFAVSWYVMDLTGSSLPMAALLAVNSLCIMAVSPFGGLISDRSNRKGVMVLTDLIQGAVLLALLALGQGRLSVGVLYAATVVLGLCGAVFSPAASAILPGIVQSGLVGAAVAAGQAASNLCIIAGMLFGGALYRVVGVSGVLALNAASNLLAAGMESRIRLPCRAGTTAVTGGREAVRRFAADLRDGLRQVRSDRPVLVFLAINTVFSFVVLPIPMVYLPYCFNQILRASPLQAGIAQAGSWIGVVLGSVAAGRALRRRPGVTFITGGLLSIAVATLVLVPILWARRYIGGTTLTALCTLCNCYAGLSGSLFVVPLYALFHARTRDEFRGRFWGLEGSLRTAAACGGCLAAGVLAARLPLEAILSTIAVLMLGMFFWALSLKPSLAPKPV